jgi:hypothetical protein
LNQRKRKIEDQLLGLLYMNIIDTEQMSVDMSVTELAIAGKRRKTQEKILFVKDQIY